MRLVLQCTLCGTINTVGSNLCGTCRASGLQNLRLMFECLHCFRLGLNPSCEPCSRLSTEHSQAPGGCWGDAEVPPGADVGAGEIAIAEEFLEAGLADEEILELPLADLKRVLPEDDDSDFELDGDEILLAELDDDTLRLDDDDDPLREGEATRGERADG